MSDVNAAPAAPAAAPSANEATINPNPVDLPAPVGSQAPEAPAAEKTPAHRREQTREAIKKAFARTGDPGPAKPKMGHNQPPEPMEKEPFSLKKRPAVTDERPRAEHGHFAARTEPSATGPDRQQPAQAGRPDTTGRPAPSAAVPALPAHAPYAAPPQRMSQRAKSEWAAAPESVRGEVHRMQHEFGQAYQRMSADVKEFNAIRRFHEMAKQHGTTLDRALSNYTGIEEKLRADPIGGLDTIVGNLNLRTPQGQKIGLRDIAWHILNQSPEQHRSAQLENTQGVVASQLQQLQKQQQAIAQGMQRLQYERAFTHTRSEVDRFAETHPRLDELGPLIEQELKLGFDLPTAYQRAELLRPAGSATQAAQTRTQTAQTRHADRSISGAPQAGPANGHARAKAPVGRRDSIANAIRHVSGSL